ncbi:hypothetical protein QYE76_055321 [Lolium multiflorum]|uniref:Uncharacterized protein n=1 Tax=Lolium multiflorum TaxID=4521 RepID=A0AAD8WLR2_LOLMU|nr:hypothetical protein QYE76_055321 [Lolium multiflorum]
MAESSNANAMVSGLKQQDGPEPVQADGSSFKFLPPAPVVLFCKGSPSLKKTSTEENSSEETQSSRRDSSSGYDLSSLLTFDPESIEPATSRAGEEPRPSTTHGQLQRLKALLSSPVETLVENSKEVKGILEDIQPHLPVTLQVKLWPAVTLPAFSAELETLRKDLENLEERVRVTKQLIQDKEALIARSREEAKGLTVERRLIWLKFVPWTVSW